MKNENEKAKEIERINFNLFRLINTTDLDILKSAYTNLIISICNLTEIKSHEIQEE